MLDSRDNLTNGFNMVESTIERMWEMWSVGMNTINWTQNQLENMAVRQLEMSKIARDESLKLVQEMAQQIRKNQEQFQKMAEDVMLKTYQQFNLGSFSLNQDNSSKS
jgi:polyhydroxyalkanoate synthesis regulator phasin